MSVFMSIYTVESLLYTGDSKECHDLIASLILWIIFKRAHFSYLFRCLNVTCKFNLLLLDTCLGYKLCTIAAFTLIPWNVVRTWAHTWEWALAGDTTLYHYSLILNFYIHPQVYDGPTSTRQDSRPRRYATGYPEPKTRTGDDAIGKLIWL